MFVLMKSCMSLKMVHVGSKTKSHFQILEKPCVCCRGHIFSPIIMKLCQNVFIDKILVMFEYGSFWVKNLVKSFEKPCVHSRGHIFSPIFIKVGQNVCLHEISNKFENVMLGQKLGHLVKP